MEQQSDKNSIKVFAPATVANVGPGYDILGFALEEVGDFLTLEKTDDGQLTIASIEGVEGLPTEAHKNVSTAAIRFMLDELGSKQGFKLSIMKNITPGSGLGSSASSSAAAVFAANELLGQPFTKNELVRFAMKGEELASGKPHADNVAPSLLGGFTIVRSYKPLDVFRIPYPEDLSVVVIFPALEVKTADAKKILKKQITMEQAITQWGNVAGLVSGLIMKDYALIERSIEDVIVEPVRSLLLPYYDEIKQSCMDNGAIGFNISGSGPSMFALTRSHKNSAKIAQIVHEYYQKHMLDVNVFVSKINREGAKVI